MRTIMSAIACKRASNNQAQTQIRTQAFANKPSISRGEIQPSNQIPGFFKNKKINVFHWLIKKIKKKFRNLNFSGLSALGGKCAAAMNADRPELSEIIWSMKKKLIFHKTTS